MFTILLLLATGLQTKPATPANSGTAPPPSQQAASVVPSSIEESAYKPLELYAGHWKMTPGRDGRPYESLVNRCRRSDLFYECTQNVNGAFVGMIVFMATDVPGRYHSQFILPSGKATGRADITIDGDLWTYTQQDEQDGKPFYHRTVNTFTGSDKIHYSQQTSTDGVHYQEKSSGDEQRVPPVK